MEKQAEVLKNNSSYLKACILYEVLQKKPVFDSYRSFCKIIGDGVMEYFDFEYWFYRFYNGNCDFDHDRSQDPKQKGLLELPVEILSRITEEIEPMKRVSFSMVSKVIKRISDITPTKLKFVHVSLINNCFDIVLDTTTIKYSGGIDVPCKLKINNDPEREIQSNLFTAGRETARRVFAMPHLQIEHLTIFAIERSIDLSLPDNLHVKSVIISDPEPNVVLGTLEHFQSGTLERIELISYGEQINLALILGSKHFLEAKEVDISWFGEVTTMEELRKFSHFTKFEVNFNDITDFYTITPETVIKIRNMLSTFKTFESCVIASYINPFEIAEIGRALGAHVPEEHIGTITHRTRIEGSDEFLEFEIGDSGIRIKKVR